MALNSLFKILDGRAAKSNLLKGALTALTVEEADNILAKMFGSEIKKFAHASYIKNKTLAIACRGSVAAQEMKLRESEIISALNQSAGERVVEKIKIIL